MGTRIKHLLWQNLHRLTHGWIVKVVLKQTVHTAQTGIKNRSNIFISETYLLCIYLTSMTHEKRKDPIQKKQTKRYFWQYYYFLVWSVAKKKQNPIKCQELRRRRKGKKQDQRHVAGVLAYKRHQQQEDISPRPSESCTRVRILPWSLLTGPSSSMPYGSSGANE